MRLIDVRASHESDNAELALSKCIDGSRVSWCSISGPAAWLSVKVELDVATPIAGVELSLFYPWGDATYAQPPLEVWAGKTFGGRDVRCGLDLNTSHSCLSGHGSGGDGTALRHIQGPVSTGVPSVVPCPAGLRSDTYPYMTVHQVGASGSTTTGPRDLRLSEVVVYRVSDKPRGMLLPSRPLVRGDVAAELSARFEEGLPNDNVSEAGVLMHIFEYARGVPMREEPMLLPTTEGLPSLRVPSHPLQWL